MKVSEVNIIREASQTPTADYIASSSLSQKLIRGHLVHFQELITNQRVVDELSR